MLDRLYVSKPSILCWKSWMVSGLLSSFAELFVGTKRFGDLRRSLHPISPKTLTDRLRVLEEKGIITRTQYPGVPLHVEYELTERGWNLQPIFAAMWEWVQKNGLSAGGRDGIDVNVTEARSADGWERT